MSREVKNNSARAFFMTLIHNLINPLEVESFAHLPVKNMFVTWKGPAC